MNKIIRIWLTSFILFVNLFSIQAQQCKWFRTFAGLGANVSMRNSALDAHGNIYGIGSFRGTFDADPGPGTNYITSADPNNWDAFVAKFDSTGQLKYLLPVHGNSSHGVKFDDIKVAPNGTAFACGNGTSGVIVVKISPSGNLLGQFNIGYSLNEAYSLDFDHSGNMVITGTYSNTADFDPSFNTYNLISQGSSNVFVAKYDTASLGFVWAESMGTIGSGYSTGTVVKVLSNQDILVGGNYGTSVPNDFDPGPGTLQLYNGGGGTYCFLCKLNSNGNFIRAGQTLSTTSLVEVNSLNEDVSGNIYVIGLFDGVGMSADPDSISFTGPSYLPGGTTMNSSSGYVLKCDTALHFIHGFSLGKGNSNEVTASMQFISNDKFYLSFEYNDSIDVNPSPSVHYWLTATTTTPTSAVCLYDTAFNFYQAFHFNSWTTSIYSPAFLTPCPGGFYLSGYYTQICDFNPGFYPEFHTAMGVPDGYMAKYVFNYNIITGKVFLDLNHDAIRQPGEPPIPGLWLSESYGNSSRNTDTLGYFSFAADSGNTVVSPLSVPHWNSVPVQNTVHFGSYWNTDTSTVFAIQAVDSFPDLGVAIVPYTDFARPGFQEQYQVTVSNNGTTQPANVNLRMSFDTIASFVSSSPTPDSISGNTLFWHNVSPRVFNRKNYNVVLSMHTTCSLGDHLNCIAALYPTFTDSVPANNADTLIQEVRGAFDPNVKVVNPKDTLTTSDHYLTYTIHFQNTGTASAVNIVVRDTLSPFLDPSSIELLSYSHPVSFSAFNDGRTSFIFRNIQLPDSGANQLLSHGFVCFRIKIKSNFVAGDTIRNTAYIYFDYNSPVKTNQTKNWIYIPTINSSVKNKTLEHAISIYPDPANDYIELKMLAPGTEGKVSIQLYDPEGQVKFHEELPSVQEKTRVDIANLPAGVYFVKVISRNWTESRKVVIFRN